MTAWVNGADDPLSGQVAMMEEARGMRRARKDGMEAETHHRLLRLGTAKKKACWARPSGSRRTPTSLSKRPRFISTRDSNGRGFLGIGGSHTLEKFVNEVARIFPIRRQDDPFGNEHAHSRWSNGNPRPA